MTIAIAPITVLRAFVAARPTQKQAAYDLGVSGPYLSDILLGKRGFSPRMLSALGLQLVRTQSDTYLRVARRQAKRRTG